MGKLKNGIKDTTIKDKAQPIDLTEDAGDIDEASENILRHSGGYVLADENSLNGPRPDSDKAR